ncbi:MAG: exo-alpha-sialidase [bacterium]|nr:exo-alpha-sialidase [bacterium]
MPKASIRSEAAGAGALALLVLLAGCSPETGIVEDVVSEAPSLLANDPPAGPGAMAPHLSAGASGVLLTWLEPVETETREHRLRASRWDGAAWAEPWELAAGGRFFANWADVPAAVELADGSLQAHWLGMLGEDTYAYGVHLTRSEDGGATWQPQGLLHDDASPVEHGFVSWVPLADTAGAHVFWLDGGAKANDPAADMQLRTARLTAGTASPETVLDDRVCECCQTDAALTASGPIVVYRDRGPTEIRDVSVIRAEGDGWGEPQALFEDAWEIHGCPVNGPSVAADGERVAVVWFTGAREQPQVKVAFSADAGRTFDPPITVDAEQPIGRCDLALDDAGGAWVSWMAAVGERGQLRLRRFTTAGPDGDSQIVADTTTSRSAGVPRMAHFDGRLIIAWVEDAEPSRLRVVVRPAS